MKTRIMLAAAALALGAGCRREPKPEVKTAADYQAQIDKVKADEKMPPQVKSMVLGQLEGQKRAAEKQQGGG